MHCHCCPVQGILARPDKRCRPGVGVRLVRDKVCVLEPRWWTLVRPLLYLGLVFVYTQMLFTVRPKNGSTL